MSTPTQNSASPPQASSQSFQQLAATLTKRLSDFEDFLASQDGVVPITHNFNFELPDGQSVTGFLGLERTPKSTGRKWGLFFAHAFGAYMPQESDFVPIGDLDLKTKTMLVRHLVDFWHAFEIERDAQKQKLSEALEIFDLIARGLGIKTEGK